MSIRNMIISLALIALLSFVHLVSAKSSLYLYSGSQCADYNPWTITGTTDGICTPIQHTFYSMKVAEIDLNCTFTVYGVGNEYCGNGYKFALESGVCYGNFTPINQFSVDCWIPPDDTESTPTSTPTPTATPIPTSGMTLTDKIALGVSIPGSLLAVGIMGFWLFRRWRKRRNMMAQNQAQIQEGMDPVEVDGEKNCGLQEAEGKPVSSTYVQEIGFGSERSELDGRPPAELWGSDTTTAIQDDRDRDAWTHAI